MQMEKLRVGRWGFLIFFFLGSIFMVCGILFALGPITEPIQQDAEVQKSLEPLGISLATFALTGGACLSGIGLILMLGAGVWFFWLRTAQQQTRAMYVSQIQQLIDMNEYINGLVHNLSSIQGLSIDLQEQLYALWVTLDKPAQRIFFQFLQEADLLTTVNLSFNPQTTNVTIPLLEKTSSSQTNQWGLRFVIIILMTISACACIWTIPVVLTQIAVNPEYVLGQERGVGTAIFGSIFCMSWAILSLVLAVLLWYLFMYKEPYHQQYASGIDALQNTLLETLIKRWSSIVPFYPNTKNQKVLQAYLLHVIRMIDVPRKSTLVAFLYDNHVLTKASAFNLMGASLDNISLERMVLPNIRFEGISLRGAKLYGANLEGAILDRSDLSGADLRQVNLMGSRLEFTCLHYAYLHQANLKGAFVKDASFIGANLWQADLRNTNIIQEQLIEAQNASQVILS